MQGPQDRAGLGIYKNDICISELIRNVVTVVAEVKGLK